jgi:Ca2+:H+ antiporter
VVSVIALVHDQTSIVQLTLLGSILSNLTLSVGLCFFFNGLGHKEGFYGMSLINTTSSFLLLSVASLLLPTAYQYGVGNFPSVLTLSRAFSVALLALYGV